MLNLLHLRTLTEVIRTGSFAAAARKLGYTGSAVSQQITSLERAIKMPLFERSPQSIRPTPVAEFLVDRAHDILVSFSALEEDVQRMAQGRMGRLRLGSFPTASQRLVPSALALYVESHPTVEIRLYEGEPTELLPKLEGGELDVALVYQYDRVPAIWPSQFRVIPVMDEELILLLPEGHPLVAANHIMLEDLADETWVSSREDTGGATCLQRSCTRVGFAPKVAYRSNDYDVIRGFVRSELGIAMVPALGHVASKGIIARRVRNLGARRRVAALHNPSQVNPALSGAFTAVAEAAATLAGQLNSDHVDHQ